MGAKCNLLKLVLIDNLSKRYLGKLLLPILSKKSRSLKLLCEENEAPPKNPPPQAIPCVNASLELSSTENVFFLIMRIW